MIALGCDHGGYPLMVEVKKHLEERGLEYKGVLSGSEHGFGLHCSKLPCRLHIQFPYRQLF